MSKPVSYEEFCIKYKLDKESKESREEYTKYKENLFLFTKEAKKQKL